MEEDDDDILTSSPQAPTQYARGLDMMSSLRNAKSEDEIRSILSKSGGNIPSELTASQARSLSATGQQQSLAMRQASQLERQRQNEFANSLRSQRAELQRKKYILDLQQQQMALKKEVSAANAMTQVLQLDPQDIQFSQKLRKLKMTNPDVIDVLSDRIHGNEFYKTHISPLEEQNDNIMKSAKDRLVNSGINMAPDEFISRSGSMNDDGTINWETLENVIAPIQEVHLANLKAAEEAKVQEAMERQRQAIAAGAKTATGKPGELPSITFQAPEATQEDIVRESFKRDPEGKSLVFMGMSGSNKPVIRAKDESKGDVGIPLKEAFPEYAPKPTTEAEMAGVEFSGQAGGTAAFMNTTIPTANEPSSLPMIEEEVTTEEQPARKPLGEIF
jgi:hypothetical protein